MPASTLGMLRRVMEAVRDAVNAVKETLDAVKQSVDAVKADTQFIPTHLPHLRGDVMSIEDSVTRILNIISAPYRYVSESLLAGVAPTYVEHRVGAELAEPGFVYIPAAYAILLKPLNAVNEVRVGGPNGPVVYTSGNCVAWWPCAIDQVNNAVVLRPGSKYYVVPVEGTTVSVEYIAITLPWLT